MTLIAHLALKDWQLFLADRRAAVLCVVVPIVLASAFSLVFRRDDAAAPPRLPVLLVVEDTSPLAQRVTADLCAHAHLQTCVLTRKSALQELQTSGRGVLVLLPAGGLRPAAPTHLDGEEAASLPPHIQVLHHPLSSIEGQWVQGLLTEVLLRRQAAEWLGPLLPTTGLPRVFAIQRHEWPTSGCPAFNSVSHCFAGMTLQYLLFWGMESGLLFLRERQRGLWRRLQVAPLRLSTLLAGKVVAITGIGLVQMLATFGFGWLVFGVQVRGPWLGLLLMALAVSGLAAATGLLVAAVGGTEARARSVCILVILAVAMLGGLWLPMFLLPAWVQNAAQFLPTTWAMRGLDGLLWQGFGWSELLPSLGMVLAFDVGLVALAFVRLAQVEARARRGDTL
jgi:ABC-2 type transport system permease protein